MNGAIGYDAAVFDCDGTLVETGSYWRSAFESIVGEQLCDRLLARLAGASTRTAAAILGRHYHSAFDPAAIEAGLLEALGEDAPLEPLPGVQPLLAYLAEAQVPMAVATNGPGEFVHAVLGQLGSYFREIVCSEQLDPPIDKPRPEVYRHACAVIGVEANRAIAFEDAEVGARSAIAAGLRLVLVNATIERPPIDIGDNLFVRTLADAQVYEFLATRPSS